MKIKLHFLLLLLVLTSFASKSFAQVPYEWPKIIAQLPNKCDTALKEINAKWDGHKYCTQFAGNLLNANSGIGYSLFTPNPAPGAKPNVNWENKQLGKIDTMLMLMDTLGYTGLEITLAYPLLVDSFPNSQVYLDFYKQVYAMAHSMGFKIIQHNTTAIGDTTGYAAGNGGAYLSYDVLNYYYKNELNGHPDTINSQKYRTTKLQMMQTVIDSLGPDYLTMEEEPITQKNNTNNLISFSSDSTLSYVKYWVKNLKHKGSILWGAGAITTDKTAYFTNYAGVNALDYIDYHLFTANDTAMLPVIFQIDSIAAANGKQIVVGECWLHSESDSENNANTYPGTYGNLASSRDNFSYFEQKDTLFTQAMINLSQEEDIPFLNFFQTTREFGYLTYQKSYGLSSEKYNANAANAINIASDSENINLYNLKLGPLGIFTKKAIAKVQCSTVSVNNIQNPVDAINIYPNPTTSGIFTIEDNIAGQKLLQVYDVMGKMVYTEVLQSAKSTIDLSNIAPGIYNISVSNNKEKLNKRLAIVR
ncbi:MAG: T9SS type A sorting domain-containing protein [Bacteroidia bacterium]